MSVTLNTQAMKYRETTADEWAPVTIQTEAEVNAVVQDTEPAGNENVWFDTSDESEVVVPTMDDLNELSDNINNNFVLLWTNPNPTSEFGEQDIYVDLSAYKAVLIDFVEYVLDPNRIIEETRIGVIGNNKSYSVTCPFVDMTAQKLSSFSYRLFYVPSNNFVHFSDAYNEANKLNLQCVPQHIYGIK